MAEFNRSAFRVVKVRFPLSIDSMAELSQFASALSRIESDLAEKWANDGQNIPPPRARLVTLHIGSPPEIVWWANPAYIAIIIAVLGNYHNYKNNIPDMLQDIAYSINRIRGLSARGKEKFILFAIGMLMTASEGVRYGLEGVANTLQSFESAARNRVIHNQFPQDIPHEPIIEIVSHEEDEMEWLD